MGAIVCYDCTDADSFSHTENWIKEFKDKCLRKAPIIIASCKNDIFDPDGSSVEPNKA